jgi:hypothetical protein
VNYSTWLFLEYLKYAIPLSSSLKLCYQHMLLLFSFPESPTDFFVFKSSNLARVCLHVTCSGWIFRCPFNNFYFRKGFNGF